MFSTCIHCNAKLGANEVIEIFPIGRRLAFDAAKGRLWVVCPKCLRWNLSPLEERWEAIEQCEREYRGTRLRASTDNIGLAKTREGLELVRIGVPPRPEMAAWRYAREFRRRWVTKGLPLAGGAAALSGLTMLNVMEGSPAAVFGAMAVILVGGYYTMKRSSEARVVLPDGRVTRLSRVNTSKVTLRPDVQHGWGIEFATGDEDIVSSGAAAERALRGVLTAWNFAGGRNARIREAVSLLQAAGGPERYLRRLAFTARTAGISHISAFPDDIRLALEMALHEDTERRAIEGELAQLETDWAIAEEVANIADNMFVPAEILARLSAIKGARGA